MSYQSFNLVLDKSWNCTCRGTIVASDDPADLSEDMCEVLLHRNNFLVSVGWSPDGDPNGDYVVTLTSGGRHLIPPIETKDVLEAVNETRDLVREYWSRSLCVTSSTDST